MNDTLELLERTVFVIEKQILMDDLEYQQRKKEYEDFYESFLQRHKGNHALRQEINKMLDAKALLADYYAQFRLRVGLQIGMELREIQVLPDKNEVHYYI